MSHTPGKWEIYHELNVQSEAGDFIASCGVNSNRKNNMEICKSNARLIASAPELLEACKHSLNAFARKRDVMTNEEFEATKELNNAIAKAEGKE